MIPLAEWSTSKFIERSTGLGHPVEKERSDLPESQERERDIAVIRARLVRLDIEKADLEASLARLLAAQEVKHNTPPCKDAPVTPMRRARPQR